MCQKGFSVEQMLLMPKVNSRRTQGVLLHCLSLWDCVCVQLPHVTMCIMLCFIAPLFALCSFECYNLNNVCHTTLLPFAAQVYICSHMLHVREYTMGGCNSLNTRKIHSNLLQQPCIICWL